MRRRVAIELEERRTEVLVNTPKQFTEPNRAGSPLEIVTSLIGQKADKQLLLQGRLLAEHIRGKRRIDSLSQVEFQVFSQFGDDGIIQWLVHNLEITHPTFVEFGVEDYQESNTRFLMMNDNWSGLVMDGSKENVDRIRQSAFFWRHELYAEAVFIDCENVNGLISATPFHQELGLLHIDLDGVDYWIWKEITCEKAGNRARPQAVANMLDSFVGKPPGNVSFRIRVAQHIDRFVLLFERLDDLIQVRLLVVR